MTAYLFEPDRWYESVVLHGRSLIYKIPHSMTVWRDVNGVWHQAQTPPWEDVSVATELMTSPEIVSDATAAELATAGFGTLTPITA